MKFYVIYEKYSDFTQFEGEWNIYIQTFSSYDDAIKDVESMKSNSNYRNIIGPLIQAHYLTQG